MSLGDHLRELRNRLIIALIAIVAGGVVGWLVYDPLLTTLSEPLLALGRSRGTASSWPARSGSTRCGRLSSPV